MKNLLVCVVGVIVAGAVYMASPWGDAPADTVVGARTSATGQPVAASSPAPRTPSESPQSPVSNTTSDRHTVTAPAESTLTDAAGAAQHVVAWGDQVFNSAWNEEPFVQVAAGGICGFDPTP